MAKAAPSFLGIKLFVERYVRRALRRDVPVLFTRHHLSHAASAFYPSPFAEAAVLTIDGVGEWATTSIAHGEGERLRTLAEIHYPHSLGLLYSAFTVLLRLQGQLRRVQADGSGALRPADLRRRDPRAPDPSLKPDGSYRLDMRYFGYLDGEMVTNERFHELFGGPPRAPETPDHAA